MGSFHGRVLYLQDPQDGSVSRRKTRTATLAEDGKSCCRSVGSRAGNHPSTSLRSPTRRSRVGIDPELQPRTRRGVKKSTGAGLNGEEQRVFCSGCTQHEKLRFSPEPSEGIWGLDPGSDNFASNRRAPNGEEPTITIFNPPEELNHYVAATVLLRHTATSWAPRVPTPACELQQNRKDLIELRKDHQPRERPRPTGPLRVDLGEQGQLGKKQSDVLLRQPRKLDTRIKPVVAPWRRRAESILRQDDGKPYGSQTIVDCQGEGPTPLRAPVDAAKRRRQRILQLRWSAGGGTLILNRRRWQ